MKNTFRTLHTYNDINEHFENDVINGIKISKNWSGYPDNATDQAEISNDVTGHKRLMIVGNKSAGAERRVGVWDSLWVHGWGGVDANWHIHNDLILDGSNRWIVHTPNDGRKSLHITPWGTVDGKEDWLWANQTRINQDGTVLMPRLKVSRSEGDKWVDGWGSGIHSWDVYANGTIGVGSDGQVAAFMNNAGVLQSQKLCIGNFCFVDTGGKLELLKDGKPNKTISSTSIF